MNEVLPMGSPNVTGQQLHNRSGHPGSVFLTWWSRATKNDGYGSLSDLLQFFEETTKVRGVVFLKRISSPEWEQRYGWRAEFHPWQPNRIRIKVKAQTPMILGSPIDFSYVEKRDECAENSDEAEQS